MKIKRTLCALLAIVMLLSMLPIAAITAAADGGSGEVTEYPLKLNDTLVTSANKDDILGDGGKAKYDPVTNTLTLDDPAGLESIYFDDDAPEKIINVDSFTIKGSWETTWDTTSSVQYMDKYAIYVDCYYPTDLILDGDFRIDTKDDAYNTCAVYVSRNVIIRSGSLSIDSCFLAVDCGNEFRVMSGVKSVHLQSECESPEGCIILAKGGFYTSQLIDLYCMVYGYRVDDAYYDNSKRMFFNPHLDPNEPLLEVDMEQKNYPGIWIAGTMLTDSLIANPPAAWGATSFDAATNTLTLDLEGVSGSFEGALVFVNVDELNVRGKAITNAEYGIYSTGALTVDGVLTVSAGSCAIDAASLATENDLHIVNPREGVFENGQVRRHDRVTVADTAYFRTPATYDLWAGGTRVDYMNASDIFFDGSASYDSETNTLTLNGEKVIEGAYRNSAIYSTMPTLNVKGDAIIRTNADYGIRSTGELTLDGDMVFLAGSCAIAADTLSFAAGKSILCPAGGALSNGAVRDSNGDIAATAGTIPYVEYDLWVGYTQVTYLNLDDVLGNGGISFDPDTNTLTLNSSDITGTHENSVIYSAMPALTVNGNAVIRKDAEYGIRATGALTLEGDILFFVNTCAIAAGTLSFGNGKTLGCPAGGALSNGAVRDANGDIAATAGTIPYVEYDLWVGDTRVTYLNKNDITNFFSRVRFDPDTNTLYIYHAGVNGTHENSLIYSALPTLNVTGEAVYSTDAAYGIRSTGDLTLSGDLNVTAAEKPFYADGALTLGEGFFVYDPYDGVIANNTVCAPDGTTAVKSARITPSFTYDLWLGDTQVTSGNHNDIFGDGTASYNAQTNTLTLNDPTIEGSSTYEGKTCKILCKIKGITLEGNYSMANSDGCDFGLCLTGENVVSTGNFSFCGTDSGVWSNKALSITSGKFRASGLVTGLRTKEYVNAVENTSLLFLNGGEAALAYGLGAKHTIVSGELQTQCSYKYYIENKVNFDGTLYCTVGLPVYGSELNYKRIRIASEEPALWVGGTKVTESNQSDVFGDGSVSYDPDTGTLTLGEFSDAKGFHTLEDGSKARIYARNMDLTLDGSFHTSLTATIFHDYDVFVDGGQLTVNGDFHFRGKKVGIIADDVVICSDGFRAKGDTDTAVRAANLKVMSEVGTAGFYGGVYAVDTNCITPYLDYFSYTGVIRNGRVYDNEGNPLTEFVLRKAELFFNLWVGSRQVHEYNYRDVLGDGKVSFDPSTNTLKMDDCVITDTYRGVGLLFEGFDLTLEGNARFVGDGNYGVYSLDNHSLTLTGPATETGHEDGHFEFRGKSVGICVRSLIVENGGVSATGGPFGIKLNGGLNLTGAKYLYAHATDPDFPVAIETKVDCLGKPAHLDTLIPSGVQTEIINYGYADDYYGSEYASVFLPGARCTIIANGREQQGYNLGLRVSELFWGKEYDLSVGNVHVTSMNAHDILGDGKASFDPSTNTLTLNEPTIPGSDDFTGTRAKISAQDFDLTVKGSWHMNEYVTGIVVKHGSLTLDGDLTFTGFDNAISVSGALTTKGSITASIIPGSIFTTTAVNAGSVNVLDGTFAVGGGDYGVNCPNGAFTVYAPDTDSVTIDGSIRAFYAGDLVFNGNTNAKEFVIASPHPAKFYAGAKTISRSDSYASIPVKHVELRPTNTYGLWVNGKSVNPENCDDIFGDGKAIYYPDAHTLTLADVEYSGAYNGAVIYATGMDLTVAGRAKLTGAGYGIKVDLGSLTVIGLPNDEQTVTVPTDDPNGETNVNVSVGVGGALASASLDGITASGTVGGFYTPDGTVTVSGKVAVSGETGVISDAGYVTLDGEITVNGTSCGVNAYGAFNADGTIDITTSGAAIRAARLNFGTNADFVSPSEWSFDSEGEVLLGADGNPAPNVSIRTFEHYGVWLGTTGVTTLNCADIFGDGRASFDPDTNVLTLHDPTIPGAAYIGAKIYVSDVNVTVRGSYYMDTDLGCYYGLYVTGGTLALDGFFAFRGTSDGVRCDRHVTVRGELYAFGASGDGVHITGGDSDGLELLQCFVTETTVIAEGGTNAVSLSSTALLPNGLELVEPAGGWIENSTKYIRDSNSAIAKHAVLRIERLADGEGTEDDPFFVSSADNWNALAAEIENGLDTRGVHFAQTANITVATMLGTNRHPFSGTFNGDGLGNGAYTLTVDLIRRDEWVIAPFRYISGATIKNVVVDGYVLGHEASGLVGNIVGNSNVIENCSVSAAVGTRHKAAVGLVLNGGSYSTSVTGCTFSGSLFSESTGKTDYSLGNFLRTLWGGSSAGAQITLTDCVDFTASDIPVGSGYGTVTLTNVYYTAASKRASDQSVWDTAKRAYAVTGVGITLTKTSACGAVRDGVLYAAEGEALGFTTSVGETALAVSDGTLSQSGSNATLTMPAKDVSVYRSTELRYDIHYTERVTGGEVYPSRIRTCAGDTVRVYTDPDAGYVLDAVTVTDSQNASVAVQTDENGDPCFTMPAGEVYLTVTFKLKYSYDTDTGELRLLCGDFGETTESRWADGDALRFMRVKSVTADPGVRFVGRMDYLFNSFYDCESFDLHNVDVSGMTSVAYMFYGCRSMTSLDITGWDLSRVTDAHNMFDDCRALTSFSFDVLAGAPLENISGMFNGCSSLAAVDLSALADADLTTVTGVFSGCPDLHSVTLAPGMSVTADMQLNNNDLGWVAEGTLAILCEGDEYGTFTAGAAETTFNRATVEFGPRYIFDAATGALTLNWGAFSTSDALWTEITNNKNSVTSVTANSGVSFVGDCSGMFYLWSNCESIDLSAADVSGMTDMSGMFSYCTALTSLDVSGWDTSGVTDMSQAFYYCSLLDSIDLSGWNTANVENMGSMFEGCISLTSIDLSGFDVGSLTDATGMFQTCTALETADLSGWDVSGVESLGCMFNGCENLESVDLRGWKSAAVTDLSAMFAGCRSLTSLDLSRLDVSSVEFFDAMFSGCASLTSLNLSGWDTSSATMMMDMFFDCSALTSLDLSGFDTSGVFEMSNMFSGCTSLVTLNISGFDLTEAVNSCGTYGLFTDADSLCLLIISPDTTITEDMCLANGTGGWIVSGDPNEVCVSGAEENAVITAAADKTVFLQKTRLAALCTAAMGAGADSSKIRADLYFAIPAGIDPHFFTVTFGGEERGLGAFRSGANGYKFSVAKPAKNMGDDIAYSLTISGVTLKSGTVSVADYAQNLASLYPQYAEFVDAMLAYGAAAQTYFEYDTANLVSNADLTAFPAVTGSRFDYESIQTAMHADDDIPVFYNAMNVTFLADTTLSIAFKIKDEYDNASALAWVESNVTLDGEAVTARVSVNTKNDYRYVIVTKQNVAITDIDKTMDLAVGTAGTYEISVLNYLTAVEAAGSDDLKLLTRALYAYSQAAKVIAG